MAGLEVNLSGEQVNQFIADAILKSVIGEQINTCIRERLADYQFKQSIARVIDSAISKLVWNLLSEAHGEVMRAAVLEKISGDVVAELAGKALDSWLASKRD